MRRVFVAALACATAVILFPGVGKAAGAPSFTGTCRFAGSESFTPPLALIARPGSAAVHAAGSCSGTLVDGVGQAHVLAGAPASYRQLTVAHSISCIGGRASGTGTVLLGGMALQFAVTEPQLTVVSALSYVAPAWSGFGVATVDPRANPLSLALACANSGIAVVPVTIVARLRAR
jgi:hypothetical protein